MDFGSSPSSHLWDPLAAPIPVAEAAQRLSEAERVEQTPAMQPTKNKNWLWFIVGGGIIFACGSIFPVLVSQSNNVALHIVASLGSWVVGAPFVFIGLWSVIRERSKRLAVERLAKLRFARKNGWAVRIENANRFKELMAAFPAFMHPRGSSPDIAEEWWGIWKSSEKEYAVWLAELQYQVSAGKHTRTEYSPIVGVKLRNSAPTSVNLAPEGITEKLLQFFRGEYKTGNAEFDAAFSIGTSAQQQSSMLSSVLTPPFIAALMQYRLRQPITVLRERDMLLVRYISAGPMLPIETSTEPGGVPPDAALQKSINALVEPVIAIVEQAGF